jgi:glutamate formiminotransferase
MPLLAIPNISESRPAGGVAQAAEAVQNAGGRLLDVHSDAVHNRSVFTTTAADDVLIEAMVSLATACKAIDLSSHVGVHPRVGALDVCPFVPHHTDLEHAIDAARRAGRAIANEVGAPVFFYGAASTRSETRELPYIRRGGLATLIERMAKGLAPDEGPSEADPRYGAVLVGARGPLIAFNVWLETDLTEARSIAGTVREKGRVRTLGLKIDDTRCQVSMNLTAPHEASIEDVFRRVEVSAADVGARVLATEIVGLVEDRFLPDPDAKVARLLIEPGHSLESALSA